MYVLYSTYEYVLTVQYVLILSRFPPVDYQDVMGGPPWKASRGMTEEDNLFVNA